MNANTRGRPSFITLLRSYGGDWFDKMEPGGWKVTLDTDEGHKAFDILMKMNQFYEPTSLNASDDEANAGMLNGFGTNLVRALMFA